MSESEARPIDPRLRMAYAQCERNLAWKKQIDEALKVMDFGRAREMIEHMASFLDEVTRQLMDYAEDEAKKPAPTPGEQHDRS